MAARLKHLAGICAASSRPRVTSLRWLLKVGYGNWLKCNGACRDPARYKRPRLSTGVLLSPAGNLDRQTRLLVRNYGQIEIVTDKGNLGSDRLGRVHGYHTVTQIGRAHV